MEEDTALQKARRFVAGLLRDYLKEEGFMLQKRELFLKALFVDSSYRGYHILEILLCNDTNTISTYLEALVIQKIFESEKFSGIRKEEVYLVLPERGRGVPFCILGRDFYSPPIFIPTVSQAFESYDWEQKYKKGNFASADHWFREQILTSIKEVHRLRNILYSHFISIDSAKNLELWPTIHEELSIGLFRERTLVRHEEKFMSNYGAPLCLLERKTKALSRVKLIINFLGRNR